MLHLVIETARGISELETKSIIVVIIIFIIIIIIHSHGTGEKWFAINQLIV